MLKGNIMQTYKLIKDSPVLINQLELMTEFRGKSSQFISQVNYWIKNGQGLLKNNKRWIYNTAKEWAEQLGVSDRQIERIIQKLKQRNVIEVEHFSKTNRVNYITLNYEKLDEILKNHSDISSDSPRHKVGIFNKETKITNKDINKSRGGEGVLNLEPSNKTDAQQVDKIEQVKKNDEKSDELIQPTNKEQTKTHAVFERKNSDDEQQNHSTQMPDRKESETVSSQENNAKKKNDTIQKTTTAQDMMDLWNRYFKNHQMTLNKDLSKNFVAAFKFKFKEDLAHFETYLKRIQSSTYLMSESFKLSLYWVLKFNTIDRILNGEFGVKEIVVQKTEQDASFEAVSHIQSVDESEFSKLVRAKLLKALGAVTYLSWFTKVKIITDEKGVHLKAETPFVQDYITTHFGYLFR